jgi:Domain of unknown function (DUF3885)
MQLPEYMQRTFPGLHLGPDLFHSWTVGLRFELNANHWPNVNWEAVLQRASTLYEAVFSPGDWGFIVSGHEFEFEPKRHAPGKMPEFRNSVFALSRKYSLGLHGVAGRRRLTTYQDHDTRIISTYRWAEIEARRIGYRDILRAVMHMDFPSRRPRIADRVYFVNRTRDIILHMYDDRGMDLIAPSVDHLRPIYERHKDWVLNYDRSSIAQMFEHAADS